MCKIVEDDECQVPSLEIFGDNETVIDVLCGRTSPSDVRLRCWANRINKGIGRMWEEGLFRLVQPDEEIYRHIYREINQRADDLSKLGAEGNASLCRMPNNGEKWRALRGFFDGSYTDAPRKAGYGWRIETFDKQNMEWREVAWAHGKCRVVSSLHSEICACVELSRAIEMLIEKGTITFASPGRMGTMNTHNEMSQMSVSASVRDETQSNRSESQVKENDMPASGTSSQTC